MADINLQGNPLLPSLLPTLQKKSYSGERAEKLAARSFANLSLCTLDPIDPGPDFCRLPRFLAPSYGDDCDDLGTQTIRSKRCRRPSLEICFCCPSFAGRCYSDVISEGEKGEIL